MRNWRKTLGMVAGGLVGLGSWVSSADAQYGPPTGMPTGMGMPGGGYAMPPMGAMPPGMAMPPSMGGPSAYPTNSGSTSPFSMSAFGGPPIGAPADFPNPAQQGEPAAPLSLKDEGIPNAFSELHDPRRREAETYMLTFNGGYINYHITNASTNATLATSNGTSLINGNNLLSYGDMGGTRLQMGFAFGYCLPLEVSGFFINHQQNIFTYNSPTAALPSVSRPVTLVDQGFAQAILPVSILNALNGAMTVTSRMSFWDVEANFLCNFSDTDCYKIDFVFGYRHLDLYESLDITSSSGGSAGTVLFNNSVLPAGSTVTLIDNFRTRNEFDGGQIGLRGVVNLFERMNLFIDTKLALGNMHEELSINGNTTASGVATTAGGLLALRSNIGQVSQNRFAIVPEGSLTLSYQLHPHFRFFAGYNVLYTNTVIRPGDPINTHIDSRQVPVSGTFIPNFTGTSPGASYLQTHSLFANGYNIGIEIGF